MTFSDVVLNVCRHNNTMNCEGYGRIKEGKTLYLPKVALLVRLSRETKSIECLERNKLRELIRESDWHNYGN